MSSGRPSREPATSPGGAASRFLADLRRSDLRTLAERARSGARKAATFVRLVAAKSKRDGITLVAAALAFITILAFIPLIAAFTWVGTRVLDRYEEQVLRTLAELLPYTQEDLVTRIQSFVYQAEGLSEVGTLIFILVGLGAFVTIEEAINTMWQVSSRRSLRAKLLSFTLLVFWGPLLIGSTYSGIAVLKQRPGLDVLFDQSLLLQAVPFLVSFAGLTMLYWQVPYTRVRFRAAMAGGLAAAGLLELIRRLFVYYVDQLSQLTFVVYGGFALAIFFMISIQLAWLAVLLGSEVAYVAQHFRPLTQAERMTLRFRGPWIGLAALLALARGLRAGKPLAALDELSETLHISPEALRQALRPLRERGLVTETGGEGSGYLLACDPYQLPLEKVLAAYDDASEQLLRVLDDDLGEPLRRVRDEVHRCRHEGLGERKLASLL